MANLGPVGTLGDKTTKAFAGTGQPALVSTTIGRRRALGAIRYQSAGGPAYLRAIHLGGSAVLLAFAARDDTQGNPTAPSQRQPRPGIFKDLFWRVTAGSRTLSIDVTYTGTAPRITLRRNPAVGLQEDVTVTAGAGSGWVTISCTFTASATGVVWVWRERVDTDLSHVCNWDNLKAS